MLKIVGGRGTTGEPQASAMVSVTFAPRRLMARSSGTQSVLASAAAAAPSSLVRRDRVVRTQYYGSDGGWGCYAEFASEP